MEANCCTCGCICCDREAMARHLRELDRLVSKLPALDIDEMVRRASAELEAFLAPTKTAELVERLTKDDEP